MTFLPIVERELRVAARRKGTYWSRIGAAGIAVAILAAVLGTRFFRLKLKAVGSIPIVPASDRVWKKGVVFMFFSIVGAARFTRERHIS